MTAIEIPPAAVQHVRHWRMRTLTGLACWGYLGLLIVTYVLVRGVGERFWVFTLALFGPRWIIGLPLIVLTPMALVFRPRLLVVLLVSVLIVAFPIMDYRWRFTTPAATLARPMRVFTCNTHHQALNVEQLRQLLGETDPDIVALQEWGRDSISGLFGRSLPYFIQEGEFAVASRYPLRSMEDGAARGDPDSSRLYEVHGPDGVFHFATVHLASPHGAFASAMHQAPGWFGLIQENRENRRRGAADLENFHRRFGEELLLAGDFNLTTDSTIYRQYLGDFTDAFSEMGRGFGITYHLKWTVTRIDHILAGKDWQCRSAWVCRSVGSPHRPLMAEFERTSTKRGSGEIR
jgi:vancomycin resistance protein VanJ